MDETNTYYGVYRAVVVDARDPMQQGRVRVRVPGVIEDTASEWALVAAGNPSEGDTVVVAFEEGDPDSPIVLGTLWTAGETVPPASRHES